MDIFQFLVAVQRAVGVLYHFRPIDTVVPGAIRFRFTQQGEEAHCDANVSLCNAASFTTTPFHWHLCPITMVALAEKGQLLPTGAVYEAAKLLRMDDALVATIVRGADGDVTPEDYIRQTLLAAAERPCTEDQWPSYAQLRATLQD
jgi:hypothetical protein